jgi:hypothetical protein
MEHGYGAFLAAALLASDAAAQAAAPDVGGWVRARYAQSDDVDVAGDDLGGFQLDNVRLNIGATVLPGATLTFAFEGGDPLTSDSTGSGLGLLDAYATIRISEHLAVSAGRYSSTVLWRTSLPERDLLFLERSFLGETWDGRDAGAEISGSLGPVRAWAGVQNGLDGAGDDLALDVCACWTPIGEPTLDESRISHLDDETMTLSLAWFDDASAGDGSALAAGLHAGWQRWGANLEIVEFEDDLRPAPVVNPATGAIVPGAISPAGAETSWGLTVGCVLVPERWEAGVRWQDLGDQAGTTLQSVVLNRHFAGPAARWTLQIDSSDSDDPALEIDVLSLGMTVGI